ncbi:MAG TPA: Trp biosynthesis-associated membrane protein [Cellulomonas sp.]
MLLLLLLAGAVGLTTLPVWVRAVASAPVTGDVDVTVSGSESAPGVVAAALVLLAAAAAVALVGRVGRWVVAVVVAGAGVLVVASALAARTGAVSAAEQAAADQTGVALLVEGPQVAPWPWLAVALGVLVVAAAVGLVRASGRWAPPSDRHERAGGAVPGTAPGPVAAEGASVEVDRAGASGPAPAPDPVAGPDRERPVPSVDERSTWDALSRGDDPT